jgi:hypothetical protein
MKRAIASAAAIMLIWTGVAGAQGKRAAVIARLTVYEGYFQGTVEDGTKKIITESTLDMSKGEQVAITLRNDLESRADEDAGRFMVAEADVTTVHVLGRLTRQGVAITWNVVEHRRDPKRPKALKRVSVGSGGEFGQLTNNSMYIVTPYRASVYRWVEVHVQGVK